tara:strand:- start:2337 stop:2723 length:387 start_codon:yes stop_codon:yes gene_type:complete
MVFVIKYRKDLIDDELRQCIENISKGIQERYFLNFHAIGMDENHMHLLVEAPPRYAPSRIMQIYKSIIAKQIFKQLPHVREELWGGHFWTAGGHIDTVGDGYGEKQMKNYIQNQGRDMGQLKLLDFSE